MNEKFCAVLMTQLRSNQFLTGVIITYAIHLSISGSNYNEAINFNKLPQV